MERRAALVAKLDVRLVTSGVLLMLHLVSRSPRNQVSVRVMSYAASIVRLKAPASLQTKGCSRPREAKKTGTWYPPRRAGSQYGMIRQAVSLH
jgi:hypothetical protein